MHEEKCVTFVGINPTDVNEQLIHRDKAICALFRGREREGMERLFEAYYKPLVVWADTFLQDTDAAADVVSEFFYAIWAEKLYLKFEGETLFAFLRVSVRNRCLHRLEKRDVLRHAEELEGVEAVFEEYNEGHEVLVSKVEEEMEHLPERTRDVVRGVFVEGLKYREVAERYDITISTVKTLIASGIKKLRERLDNDTYRQLLLFIRCRE